MKLRSTRNPDLRSTWREAVLSGIAPDGGLFIPQHIPHLSPSEIERLRGKSFVEVASSLAQTFIGEELSPETIADLCRGTWDFEIPLKKLTDTIYVLELFHGPTCAFKDFGARFMAKLFRHFWGAPDKRLTVLVATSGDTGSAVANAFFDPLPDAPIRVVILYPRDKVSEIQRRQMTTLGGNVTAYEVNGTFDDCQALAKRALQDQELVTHHPLTSANSINIARLLPQMFYYAYAILKLPERTPPVMVVPSGNLGNVTGALLAHLCGFQMHRGVVACNANKAFPDFLQSGAYQPRPSQETISNAMDVGAPSNFFRINSLVGQDSESCLFDTSSPQADVLAAYSASDDETRQMIRHYYAEYGYIIDPHTAVGAAAVSGFESDNPSYCGPIILVSTAHPAKFPDVVKECLGVSPQLPPQLAAVIARPEHRRSLGNDYGELRLELVRD